MQPVRIPEIDTTGGNAMLMWGANKMLSRNQRFLQQEIEEKRNKRMAELEFEIDKADQSGDKKKLGSALQQLGSMNPERMQQRLDQIRNRQMLRDAGADKVYSEYMGRYVAENTYDLTGDYEKDFSKVQPRIARTAPGFIAGIEQVLKGKIPSEKIKEFQEEAKNIYASVTSNANDDDSWKNVHATLMGMRQASSKYVKEYKEEIERKKKAREDEKKRAHAEKKRGWEEEDQGMRRESHIEKMKKLREGESNKYKSDSGVFDDVNALNRERDFDPVDQAAISARASELIASGVPRNQAIQQAWQEHSPKEEEGQGFFGMIGDKIKDFRKPKNAGGYVDEAFRVPMDQSQGDTAQQLQAPQQQPQGQPLTNEILDQLLDETGNDAELAKKLARQRGYVW